MRGKTWAVAALVAAGFLGGAGAATAQDAGYGEVEEPTNTGNIDNDTTEPEVLGVEVVRPPSDVLGAPAANGEVLSQASSAPTSGGSTLPVTGGDVASLALLGAGAIAAGTVIIRKNNHPLA